MGTFLQLAKYRAVTKRTCLSISQYFRDLGHSQPGFLAVNVCQRVLILSVMTTQTKIPLPQFYAQDDVAEMFKVSRSTVYRLRLKDQWPHSKVAGEIRFSLEDIAAIRAMYHKPAPEPRRQAPRIPKRGENPSPRIPRSASMSKLA